MQNYGPSQLLKVIDLLIFFDKLKKASYEYSLSRLNISEESRKKLKEQINNG